MTLFRRSRLLFLIIRELASKYTKSLALGFVSGLVLSLVFWRVTPFIREQWFTPVDRIGIVGDFTPTTIPLSIQNEISGGLTKLAPDGTVLPSLATSWTATDSGKTFIFTLRKDINWQNGDPVVADDINYNIRNVTFSPIDSHTIKASLGSPYSPFSAVVSKPLFLSGLVGWGPYKVTAIQLNGNSIQSMRLVPSNEKKHVKDYSFYRTEAEAILAYKLGEISSVADLSSPGDIGKWGNSEVIASTNYNRIVALYFNVNVSMLSNRNIRQGLSYAVPRPKDWVLADSPISKKSWAYSTDVKTYTYDVTEAKKLLGDALDASASSKLTISTFAPYLSDAQDIADSWTKLGIKTDVRVVPSVPQDYEVLLSAQNLPPDPDQYPFWHSTQTVTNITNYANVKVDKLLEDGRQELNMTKRRQIYAEFQRYITEDEPAVYLYYPTSYDVQRR